jgi:PAS domain S-box-containing protein
VAANPNSIRREISPLGIRERLALLDVVACGVWVYDGTDTRYVNQALGDITGYSCEELLEPLFFENLIHPDDRDMIVERGQARVRGETVSSQYEVRIITKKGDTRTLSIDARRLELEDGAVSVVSAVDVTPLHEAERTIRDGTAQVLELLHSVPAHVITTDAGGKPTFVNRHWLRYTGQSFEEAMAAGTAPLIHPEDRVRANAAWTAAKGSGEPYDIDYRVRAKSGEYRWQNFRIRPLKDRDGTLSGWTAASVDVHEEKELRARLEGSNELLADAIRAKDEVLGLISHELRTPLTTLLGNAQLLRRRGSELDDATRVGVLTDLEADAQRLYSVIENMLVLSRAAADQEMDLEPARLNLLAERVVREFQSRAPEREIVFTQGAEVPLAMANPTYYAQIVQNLLSNAQKYSPPGTPITLELRVGSEAIETVVTDRGPGLSEHEVAHVFEPFFRAHAHSGVHGIGLGLTVCQRLVELQGGTIRVRNLQGGGCEFSFTSRVAELMDE